MEDNPIKPGENQPNPPAPNPPLDPEIQRRDAQIAHHRDKADKLQQEFDAYKAAHPAAPAPTPPASAGKDDVEFFEAPTDPLEVVRLGKALQGYSEQETEFIIRNAQKKDVEGIINAEKDEMVRIAIQSMREKVKKETQVPPPSGSGSSRTGEKSLAEIAKMTREEHQAYEREILAQQQGNQGI